MGIVTIETDAPTIEGGMGEPTETSLHTHTRVFALQSGPGTTHMDMSTCLGSPTPPGAVPDGSKRVF